MTEKYYKILQRGGHTVRLSVFQREGYSGPAVEIGDFVDLRLELQGGQEDVDAPIVKTSCTFSMVDSRDKVSTAEVKYGAWEEFYTPDATLYLVRIYVDGASIWRGYVTPDSWEDDLHFRGIVTVTARDMVGHLADFEFSPDDLTYISSGARMVSVMTVLQRAFAIASIPMSLNVWRGDHQWLAVDSTAYPGTVVRAYDWAVDANSFDGKDWYELVEDLLAALGLTLRYSGQDTFVLTPIRNLPLCGHQYASSVVARTPVFINRTGHRTLSPAYRQIVEEAPYDPMDAEVDTFTQGDFVQVATGDDWRLVKDGWELLVSDNTGEVWSPDSSLLNAMRYYDVANPYNDEASAPSRYVMLLNYAGLVVPLHSWRRSFLVAPRTGASIAFSLAHMFFRSAQEPQWSAYSPTLPGGTLMYRLEWAPADGSSSLFLTGDGEWTIPETSAGTWNTYSLETDKRTAEFNIDVVTPDTPGILKLWFWLYNPEGADGIYVRLGEFQVETQSSSIPKGLKVTTKYDLEQNFTLKRDAAYAQLPSWIKTAGSVTNGVYTPDAAALFPPVLDPHWELDQTATPLPLPVHNHMQILAFHAKANNVLTGDLIIGDGEDCPDFHSRWEIYGRTFLLHSGTLSFKTFRVEDAILVEYDAFSAVWPQISVEYSSKDDEYRAGEMSSSISVSGGGGGAGGTVTYVGLQVPTGLTVEGSPVTTAGTFVIKLATGRVIPTSANVNKGVTAYGWGNHANAGYALKTYVDSEIASLPGLTAQLQPAPRLVIRRGVNNLGNTQEMLFAYHPMLGVTGYEAVLMVYAERNGRSTSRSSHSGHANYMNKKGWCVAIGSCNITDHAETMTFGGTSGLAFQELDLIRDYIIKRYTSYGQYSSIWIFANMDYVAWTSDTTTTARGFRSRHKQDNGYKRFGIALRYLNPAFTALVQGELSEYTQEIDGVPRYLYSDVAPLDAYFVSDPLSGNKRRMMFGLKGE